MRPYSFIVASAVNLRLSEEERKTWLQLAVRLYDLWSYIDKNTPLMHWNRHCPVIEWGVLTKAFTRPDGELWPQTTRRVLGKRTCSRFGDHISDWIFNQRQDPLGAAKRIFFFLCGNEKLLPACLYDEVPLPYPPEFKEWMEPFARYGLPAVRQELGQPCRGSLAFGEDSDPAFLEKVYPELAPIIFD